MLKQALFALVGISAMAAAPAFADTITYGPTLFGTYSIGDSGPFSVPQFDPSLGTLTSVSLSVTGNSAGGSNGLQNLSFNPGNASVTIGSNITVTGPSALVVLTTPSQSNTGPVAPYGGAIDFTFSGPDSVNVVGTTSTDTQSDSILSGFAPYLGLGSVNFNYTSAVNITTSATVSPTFSSTTAPTFDFTPTVVYTYTPSGVPEPASLGLLGLGAVGLLARRRK